MMRSPYETDIREESFNEGKQEGKHDERERGIQALMKTLKCSRAEAERLLEIDGSSGDLSGLKLR